MWIFSSSTRTQLLLLLLAFLSLLAQHPQRNCGIFTAFPLPWPTMRLTNVFFCSSLTLKNVVFLYRPICLPCPFNHSRSLTLWHLVQQPSLRPLQSPPYFAYIYNWCIHNHNKRNSAINIWSGLPVLQWCLSDVIWGVTSSCFSNWKWVRFLIAQVIIKCYHIGNTL